MVSLREKNSRRRHLREMRGGGAIGLMGEVGEYSQRTDCSRSKLSYGIESDKKKFHKKVPRIGKRVREGKDGESTKASDQGRHKFGIVGGCGGL